MARRLIAIGGVSMLLLILVMLAVSITAASPDNQQGAARTAAAGTAQAAATRIAATAGAATTRIAGTAQAASTQLAATLDAVRTQAAAQFGTIAPTMTAIRATLDAIPETIPTQVMAFFEALDAQTSMEYDPETGTITIGATATENQLNIAVDAAVAALGYHPDSMSVDLLSPNLVAVMLIDASTGNTYIATYAMGITGSQFSAALVGLTINGRTVSLDQIPPIVNTASGVILESLNGVFEVLGITYMPQSITVDDVSITTVVMFTLAQP